MSTNQLVNLDMKWINNQKHINNITCKPVRMNIIIFGTSQLAELAKYYIEEYADFSTDTSHNIVAFTVHKEFRDKDTYHDIPVIDFEDIKEKYPPSKYFLFAPMTGKNLNKIREKVYLQGKEMGYRFYSYISPNASILTDFSNLGENCFILEDNTIQPYVKIGNNCVLWSGNHIGHHSIIEDHVFFSSHVVLSGNCYVKSYSWFGVNSTIRDSTVIEEGVLVGMSASIVKKQTEPYTVYLGVPAKPVGKSDIEKVMGSL